jgi:hypothetical protein
MNRKMIAVLGILIGTGVLADAAYSQDFYDRSNRQRRHQDWGRGYNDGYDCHNMAMKVVQDYCDLQSLSSRRRGGYGRSNCSLQRDAMDQSQLPSILEGIASGRYQYRDTDSEWDKLKQDAQAAQDCYGGRRDSFERDTQADSDRYHREQEERERRESGEEGAGSRRRR